MSPGGVSEFARSVLLAWGFRPGSQGIGACRSAGSRSMFFLDFWMPAHETDTALSGRGHRAAIFAGPQPSACAFSEESPRQGLRFGSARMASSRRPMNLKAACRGTVTRRRVARRSEEDPHAALARSYRLPRFDTVDTRCAGWASADEARHRPLS